MKRKIIMICLIVIFPLIVLVSILIIINNFGMKQNNQNFKHVENEFPGINEVKSASLVIRHTALNSKYYYFDLNNEEQKNVIIKVIDSLNSGSSSISVDNDPPEMSAGGQLHPYLKIVFNNDKFVNISYTFASKPLNKITIEGSYIGKRKLSEESEEMIKFLDSNWDEKGYNMKSEIK